MNGPTIVAILVAGLAGASGCSREEPDAATAAGEAKWEFERTYNEGTPVTLTLRLDRTRAGLADKLVLEQELAVDPGFEADFPEYLPEDFEGFAVVEIERPRQDGAGDDPARSGPARRTKRLTLEPNRSGELTIHKLAVYFHKAGENTEQSFETDEVPVEIESPGNIADLRLAPMRDIYPAAPVAASRRWAWIAAGALAIAAAAGLASFYLLRRKALAPPPAPPHELAYDALRRLVALGLIEKGEVELFFVHLSNILREYIERRFGVQAPERTTEEFLEEAARDQALSAHRTRLSQFLSLCDQVKFARHQPDEAAIQNAFDVVKRFIAETTPAEGAAA